MTRCRAAQLSLQPLQCRDVIPETLAGGPEEAEPGFVALQRKARLRLTKAGLSQGGRALVFLGTPDKSSGEESSSRFKEQMKPGGFSLLSAQNFQLMGERTEVTSGEEILEFGRGCWHAAGDLIATDAGEGRRGKPFEVMSAAKLLGPFVAMNA